MSEHALKPWDRERHSDPGPFANHSGNVKKKNIVTHLVNWRFRLDNVAVILFQIYNDSFKVSSSSVTAVCVTFVWLWFPLQLIKGGNGSNVIYFYYESSHFLTHCIVPFIDLIINKVSYTLL